MTSIQLNSARVETDQAEYVKAKVYISADRQYALVCDRRGKVLERIDGPVSDDGQRTWTVGTATIKIMGGCPGCGGTKVRSKT